MNHTPKKPCPLRNEWKQWSESKKENGLFMICPACGCYGSHVVLGEKEK